MSEKPIISVIVPVYNVEKYILDLLKSLSAQTFKNFELILVNDGTKDNSIAIAENYLKKTAINYKIINQENKGTASARNTGLKYAIGEWIVMPDSDDILDVDFLEELYTTAIKYNADMTFCLYRNAYDYNNIYADYNCDNFSIKSDIIKYNREELFNSFLIRKLPLIPTALLIKHELIVCNNLYFEEKQIFGEDQQFIWKLIPFLNKALQVTKPMYIYRVRPLSKMTTPNILNMIQSYFVFKNTLIAYYNKIDDEISETFLKYGVARFAIALYHTSALKHDYEAFIDLIRSTEYKKNTKRLITFPDIKIRILASILYLFPKLFFSFFHKAPKIFSKFNSNNSLNRSRINQSMSF
ncbi:glycosyltransferase family 2 protein [Patescibacteria group bacterium]|nr:glycosyltransferase family 2 protein [Patescibacteria group bacterium]